MRWTRLTIACSISQRYDGDKTFTECRYYISSLACNAELIAQAIRKHWGIENSLHWVLDVTYREDDSRIRRGYAAENMSVLRQMTLNLIKQEKNSKKSVKKRRLRAALDDNYCHNLLFGNKFGCSCRGITNQIRQAFVVYLAGDARPIHELLSPNQLNIEHIFHSEFTRMTDEAVTLADLISVREKLITTIQQGLTEKERLFLMSVKQGEPQYELMPFKELDRLPALRWKVLNVERMDKKKQLSILDKLKSTLEM